MAFLSVLLISTANVDAADNVRAELGKASAWTGEPVPLIVTLFSPGPFQGTAAFDLPELPRTVFLKAGSPLVGSEEVDGESYITQRHELNVVTQVDGELVIPSFRIRFEGKLSFVGDALPMEGKTPEMRLRVKRPPGTEKLPLVVVASDMKLTQTWHPDAPTNWNAGDVIRRTITRQATGTSAMFFSPLKSPPMDGVRVYEVPPLVQDRSERGESISLRTDGIKYQFESGGTYSLPAITFTWWDPQAEQLQTETLAGREITVTADGRAAIATTKEEQPHGFPAGRLVLALGIIAVILWSWWQGYRVWRAKRDAPESAAARNVRSACRTADPISAYDAFLAWRRIVNTDVADSGRQQAADDLAELQAEWQKLSKAVYAADSMPGDWNAEAFRTAFDAARRQLMRRTQTRHDSHRLAQLNPTSGR